MVGQCWVDLKQTRINTDKEEREREREKLIKYCIQSLHCSIFVYLQRLRKTDVGVFCVMLCKFLHFLFFAMTDAIALRRVNPHFCTIKVGQFLVIESSMQEIDV